jgi:hypothetical protein
LLVVTIGARRHGAVIRSKLTRLLVGMAGFALEIQAAMAIGLDHVRCQRAVTERALPIRRFHRQRPADVLRGAVLAAHGEGDDDD